MALDMALLAEATGFLQSLEARADRLELPRDRARPVLLPAYRGTLGQPNLTALIALLLQRYGVPVLMHGATATCAAPRERTGRPGAGPIAPTSTAEVLWELGVEPAGSRADARERLLHDGIAYAPIDVLAPGLAQFVAARETAEGRSLLPALAAMLDPFGGDAYRVIGVADDEELAVLRGGLIASRGDALIFLGAEGEPFADPRRQTQLEHVARGVATVCVETEVVSATKEALLPRAADAASTAAWITQAMAGSVPLPPSIVAQLGCCLNGARRLTAAA